MATRLDSGDRLPATREVPAARPSSSRIDQKGKTLERSEFDLQADAAKVYFGLQPAYRKTLVAPQDDMWATFADAAAHYALLAGGETLGCCSVNEDRELLFFHLRARFEDRAEAVFGELIERLELVAALPSTVDPGFLSLSLEAGHGSDPKALLFHHLLEPAGTALSDLRLASTADHPAATAFAQAATDMPRSFLEPYFAERIDKRQLFLHQKGDEVLATGECRDDERQAGHAHVGLIVGRGRRGKGLGSRLMHALVLECRRRKLKPLCSTEPENLAARRVIHKAGFRARHRVFRVALRQAGSRARGLDPGCRA